MVEVTLTSIEQGIRSISYYHLPLLGYFLAILYLIYTMYPNYAGRARPKTTVLFHSFAIISLSTTWNQMLLYFERSFYEAALRANVRPTNYTIEQWLKSTSLFNEAWLQVCLTAERWWWSEQLCLWTIVLTVFLFVEARRSNVKKPTAFLLFGFIVAISVAQNLFLAISSLSSLAIPTGRRLDNSSSRVAIDDSRPGWILIFSVSTALFTIGLTPSLVPTQYFLPNLLVMHAVLLLPFIASTHSSKGPISYSQLYLLLAVASLALRMPTYANVLSLPITTASLEELAYRQIEVFMSLPSQASISFDVVCSSMSFLVWMMLKTGSKGNLGLTDYVAMNALFVLTPVTGIGFTGALFLSWRESWNNGVKTIKID